MMMIDGLAAPLAQALADKGYATLTAVQEAVLAEGVAGRDVLVSAQTGSGKTVAFGLAIAPEVLAGAERLEPAERPLALVVAPTRELALQVRREFEWLYAPTGAVLASCVGGMDYRTERRTLDRGAHVVVGTPGRLRDHIERGSLDLSGVAAVVLDEADEMLDLGFAEDLEFILGAAPEGRRTLMFSATVPKEIEALARTFQRDALRIVAQGEARQHVDIDYRALSVAVRDKEHAIFNLLRWHEARTAIVFAKTRANVNHLFARMGNRGFQVVALSGELSQQERTHALQALRDGRARVCIATDVAARGIDLPGLELVVHADLPSNPETLLHRSGRTGRAGRKGTSVLIVTPAEARKAQRILQGAKVEAEWGKAPSADEVQARDDERLMAHPTLEEAPGEEAAMAEALVARHGADRVAAAFVRLWREGRSAPEVLSDSLPPPPALPVRPRGEFGPAVWYRLSVGHTGRAEARWLLPKVCEAGGIGKDGIGAIRVQQEVTFIQIAAPMAARFGEAVEIEPGLTMTKLDGEPDMSRPERGAPARGGAREERPRREKPAYAPKAPRVVEEEAGSDVAPSAPDTTPAAAAAGAPRAEAEAPRKPYAKHDDGDAPRKPYVKREAAEGAERRPYVKRDDADAPRKPYARREEGDAPRKPYARREEGDAPRKPYAPRAAAEGAERRPYVKRDDAEAPRKPYARREEGDAPRKPYVKRDPAEGAERRPYVKRDDGDAPRKPRWTPEDRATRGPGEATAPRSAGYKSHGGSPDRPARSTGFKSHAAEGTGFKPRREEGASPRPPRAEGDGPRKPWAPKGAEGRPAGKGPGKPWDKAGAKPAGRATGFKSHAADGAGKKPYGKPAARPARPPADASDTSRRFVPPKKKD
jgi:ATP-dependent RNA helicase DeaD